jgi:CDP-diglyceride synthetase
MSPKKFTQLGLIIGVISIVGLGVMVIVRPGWGWLGWWPVLGLGIALLCFITAFGWGAYLSAQKRAALVDKLNDCYTGVPAADKSGD